MADDAAPRANPWRTAVPDWAERIVEGRSLIPDLPLFKAEAARGLRIFKRLRIPDVIGQPRMADACGRWYFDLVAALCGSYDPQTHRRMISEFFQLIPKGNAKSSNGGALMLTAAIMNRRPEAEFDLIAPTMKIANIAFSQAAGTVRADPELDKLFQVRDHIRTIEHRTLGTVLQIKAADTDVVTGGKAVGTMIDETHVFAEKSNAADIFVEIRGALGKRPDGFLIQTTTQSKKAPAGVFAEELNRARRVRDGEIDLPLLPMLYEYPEHLLEKNRWQERKYWHLVNPNLGRSLDEDFLARTLGEAISAGGEKLMLVASQHFNVEIGTRLRSDRWRGADYWDDRADSTLTLEALLARCEVAVIGIDGGGNDDLFALCVAGRERDSHRWLYWTRAWVHRHLLRLRPEIAPALLDFVADGDLVLWGTDSGPEDDEDVDADMESAPDPEPVDVSDGEKDISEIVSIIAQVQSAGLLPEKAAVGLDPIGVGGLVDALSDIGLVHPQVVAVAQGFRLSSAVWSLERKLRHRSAVHAGARLMSWCIGNAKCEQKGNAVLITKQTAGKAKIDPLIAAFNATKLLENNPVAEGLSIYRERGVLVV